MLDPGRDAMAGRRRIFRTAARCDPPAEGFSAHCLTGRRDRMGILADAAVTDFREGPHGFLMTVRIAVIGAGRLGRAFASASMSVHSAIMQ